MAHFPLDMKSVIREIEHLSDAMHWLSSIDLTTPLSHTVLPRRLTAGPHKWLCSLSMDLDSGKPQQEIGGAQGRE